MKTHLDALPPACRAFLAAADGATADHPQGCAACAQRLRLRTRLGAAIGTPPSAPAALSSPAFLAGVHERIVADVERTSGFVAALATPQRAATPIAAPTPALLPTLAQALADAPRADAAAWSDVREAVITGIRGIGGKRARRRRARILFALAGAAALAAVLPLVIELAAPPNVDNVDIAFADLDRAPAGEFTVLRGGIPR